MVLTARDDRYWRLGWKSDGSISLIEHKASMRRSYKVARIWTAGEYRRNGLAVQLIHTASRLLPCAVGDLGWELPFTSNGRLIVQHLCPDKFWGCGSPFSLQDTIETCATHTTGG